MKRVKKSVSQINERSRHRLEVPLMFKVIESTQEKLVSDKPFETTIIDISSGGVRFHCDLPVRREDVLKVKLSFPSEEIIAIGKVVRIDGPAETDELMLEGNAVALEFIDLPNDRRERIRQLITPKLSLKQEESEEEQEHQEEPGEKQKEGLPAPEKKSFDPGDFLPKKPE